MAIFQHNYQTLPYETDFAPFSFDLLLLQSSRFTPDFWRPVLEDFSGEVPAGGRVIRCESPFPDAETFERFLSTLGLHGLHVVAFGDAVDLVKEVTKLEPASFSKTLLFPQGGPKGDELTRTVREFCGL